MKKAYIGIPEGQIHYRTAGNGDPILMLHQTALSSEEFSEVVPILGKSHQVIALDTMGYGNSDPPPYQYSVEDYAMSVVHFLDALSITRTSLVGHHTGAAIAVETAAAYPERIDKLVLSGCPYLEREVRKAWLVQPRYKPMEIGRDGAHITELWNYYSSRWPHFEPEVLQKVLADYLKADLGRRAVDAYHAVYAYDIEPRLALVMSPTLLITGTGDTFYDRREATKRLIPRCRIHIIDGTHDHPAWEKPKEFARAILDFLDESSGCGDRAADQG